MILEVQPSDAEIAEDCGGFEAFRVAACAKVVLTSVTRKPGQKLKNIKYNKNNKEIVYSKD